MKYWLGVLLGSFLLVLMVPLAPVSADVNDFRISSFDIEYTLSKDEDGNSVLRTVEKIQAEFPFRNQNRGIERAIPIRFDNRTLPLEINSVTDKNGTNYKYSERGIWDLKTLRIGDPNKYARGTHIYNINYTQKHVTRYYEDTDRVEWYWDTNGTDWRVPIDQLNIKVNIDEAVVGSLVGQPQCYIGKAGSTDKCEIIGSEGTYNVFASGLSAGENVTLAFGFKPETFNEYKPSLSEVLLKTWIVLTILTTVLGIATIVILGVKYSSKNGRKNELTPVVVEYIPPRDASVVVAAQVYRPKKTKATFSAQLIDLAVRRYIKIVEVEKKTLMIDDNYDLVVSKDLSDLREEEKEILTDMFGKEPAVGDRINLYDLRLDYKYARRLADNNKKLTNLILTKYGLRAKNPEVSKYFRKWFIILVLAAVVTLSPVLFIASMVALVMSSTIRPLTDKGLALKRYVIGFEAYIKAAESERLAFLQGPDTAEKVGETVDVNDKRQVVKLYERALPYAVLYGHEKEWTKRLGEFYQELKTEPDWYTGRTAFNAALFTSAITSFSDSATSYASSSSDSSSSGGSSGGGYSGGGGGGGGGGGW